MRFRSIGVKLPEEDLEKLKCLVDNDYAADISELIRLAVKKLLLKHVDNIEESISP